jgi:uroporphyrinogen decarboxylase
MNSLIELGGKSWHLPGMTKKLLIQALHGQTTASVPFWLMRQAGRYLPEYRDLRAKAGSFLNLCYNPDMAAAVTLQPLDRFDMDAAILFSDILVVPHALGQKLDFVEGEGPRLEPVTAINEINFDSFDKKLAPVYEAIRLIKKQLKPEKALIGFAGAPWTVACYMVQGFGDGKFESVQKFALGDPDAFDKFIGKLVEATTHYLLEQIKAGVDAVQIFDSWAGLLPNPHFGRWVIIPTQKIVSNIRDKYPTFPIIGFPRRAGMFYNDYVEQTNISGIGIDEHYQIEKAIAAFGDKVAVQGNLDPVTLLAGGATLEGEVKRILAAAGNAPFIFNLGHGIIKETPPGHVAQLAQLIKSHHRE